MSVKENALSISKERTSFSDPLRLSVFRDDSVDVLNPNTTLMSDGIDRKFSSDVDRSSVLLMGEGTSAASVRLLLVEGCSSACRSENRRVAEASHEYQKLGLVDLSAPGSTGTRLESQFVYCSKCLLHACLLSGTACSARSDWFARVTQDLGIVCSFHVT